MTMEKQMASLWRLVSTARSEAIKVLRAERPDLYELSAQRFGHEEGSIPHLMRLGEFLTEWNNALGCAPIQALADGRTDAVAQELSSH